jgi:hypothetical protein
MGAPANKANRIRRPSRRGLRRAGIAGAVALSALVALDTQLTGPPSQGAAQRGPEHGGRSSHPALAVARRYAEAAQSWTAANYAETFGERKALATRAHRSDLRAAAPQAAGLRALRAEEASSSVRVLGADLAAPGRRRARVLLALRERVIAAGELLEQETLNAALVVRERGRWRVDGWTLVPSEGAIA